MVTKRLSKQDGHRRKFLSVIDDTPECERAVLYAAHRAKNTNGGLILLYVIEPSDFQHWLGVEEVMRQEAREQAEETFARFAALAREGAGIDPEFVVREGTATEEIHSLIEEDQDIAILVLASGSSKEGPGPLVASIAGRNAAFPIPVTVVPATLSDEDIQALS